MFISIQSIAAEPKPIELERNPFIPEKSPATQKPINNTSADTGTDQQEPPPATPNIDPCFVAYFAEPKPSALIWWRDEFRWLYQYETWNEWRLIKISTELLVWQNRFSKRETKGFLYNNCFPLLQKTLPNPQNK